MSRPPNRPPVNHNPSEATPDLGDRLAILFGFLLLGYATSKRWDDRTDRYHNRGDGQIHHGKRRRR